MTGSRIELRDWYTRRLRPKVVRAARAGAIEPVRAVELERQMSGLLQSGGGAAPLDRQAELKSVGRA